jgi:ribose 5-phosphate isomerase A
MELVKKRAAIEACKQIKDGDIVGLGTGSTAAYAIKEIGRLIRKEKMQLYGVPTSRQTYLLAIENSIPITSLRQHPRIDIDIDGADQIDENLNLIKGGGGALTREKIIASASKEVIIIADESKLVKNLGKNYYLPIEILEFAESFVKTQIKKIGGKPFTRINKNTSELYKTDNGNIILDIDFDIIYEPIKLDSKLQSIPGIIETGLFIGMVDKAYIGTKTTVKKLD